MFVMVMLMMMAMVIDVYDGQFEDRYVCGYDDLVMTTVLLAADSGGHGGSDYWNIGCSRLLCWS